MVAEPLVGNGNCASWVGCAEWTGNAVLRIMGLRYHEEKEGYHSIVNFHLHNPGKKHAALRAVMVTSDGLVKAEVVASELEDPDVTAKAIATSRAASLSAYAAAIPPHLKRIVENDGLMHCQVTRHHDPCGQPMPSWYGLPTVSDISLKSAQRILKNMTGVCCECLPDDADDATLLAVGLAMHAGKWSVELLDDRELTMMLGEDCDDMVIRARSVFQALKRHLRNLDPCNVTGRRICDFIRTHQMLSCQGHASPPHPLDSPGEVIGHVYGLFVDDVDWRSQFGLKSGIPVEMTNHEFVNVLKPCLCEATAPSRSNPAPVGRKLADVPGVANIRTAEGDESYQSLQQAQCDDGVVYFFEADKSGRWVGGINGNEILRAPGSAPRPEKKVCVLLMQADPSTKARTDSEVIMNEADPTVLESLYQAYRKLMAQYNVHHDGGKRPSADASSTYHLTPRFFEQTSCSFKY